MVKILAAVVARNSLLKKKRKKKKNAGCHFCACIYSAAWKFVNPLEYSIFLHKYDPQLQIFAQVLKVDKENPIKQMRQKYFLCHLFTQENGPIMHFCEWQKYVNLFD